MTAARHAFYGGAAPASTVLPISASSALWVTFAFAMGAIGIAVLACRRKA